MNIRHIDCS